MAKIFKILTINILSYLIVLLQACSDDHVNAEKLPRYLMFTVKDLETNEDLLLESDEGCPRDSIMIQFFYGKSPVDELYDTNFKAILLPIQPHYHEGEDESRTGFLYFCNYDCDTILLKLWDIEYGQGSLGDPVFSLKFSFSYNDAEICNPCQYDSIYEVYK